MAAVTGREYVVRDVLAPLHGTYDWILLDCSPSLGIVTVNALTAADAVLVPLQCETLSHRGVGQLMEIAVAKGRTTRPGIKLGICGEHGGDPDSVKFCHKLGLTYVSCSPFRVPVARLAAAQAAVAELKAAKKK